MMSSQNVAPLPTEPMLLPEILTKYANDTLADENDLSLSDAQTTLGTLIQIMNAADQLDFWSTYQPLSTVSTCQLIAIQSFISRTLNARYGCND